MQPASQGWPAGGPSGWEGWSVLFGLTTWTGLMLLVWTGRVTSWSHMRWSGCSAEWARAAAIAIIGRAQIVCSCEYLHHCSAACCWGPAYTHPASLITSGGTLPISGTTSITPLRVLHCAAMVCVCMLPCITTPCHSFLLTLCLLSTALKHLDLCSKDELSWGSVVHLTALTAVTWLRVISSSTTKCFLQQQVSGTGGPVGLSGGAAATGTRLVSGDAGHTHTPHGHADSPIVLFPLSRSVL